jgi:nucleotide-binding universal stress UspA family protein
MQSTVNNILIPIDFSINTEVAITKTLQLFGSYPVHIHLLHIVKSKPTFAVGMANMVKLDALKINMLNEAPSLNVTYESCTGRSIQNKIIAKAKNGFDLIIIGKNNSHPYLQFLTTVNADKLSTVSNVPVLTAKPGALHHNGKTIVVPVKNALSLYKMNILEALCRNSNVRVYLLACNKTAHPDENTTSSLIQIYQWIKSSFHCHVEYASIISKGGGRAILNFAQMINADILLLQAEVETKIYTLNIHIQDIIPSGSKLQIFSICSPQ